MATIQDRPFSEDYSGLTNQSVIAGGILLFGISVFEFNKRKQKVRRFKEVLEALEEDVVSQGLWE